MNRAAATGWGDGLRDRGVEVEGAPRRSIERGIVVVAVAVAVGSPPAGNPVQLMPMMMRACVHGRWRARSLNIISLRDKELTGRATCLPASSRSCSLLVLLLYWPPSCML